MSATERVSQPEENPPEEVHCRVCDSLPATGDDDLCDGCRTAIIARRLRRL